ncbi:MAG: hypothetical protein FWF43_08720 [Propionibacteriaceae bacterium]|nr:hypothetical protein [Propionibacteriaceae bacterium]
MGVLATSGCSSVDRWKILDGSTAALADDVVMAVYVSHQSSDSSMSGYVLLVDSHGGVSAVRTSGMDLAQLVWDEQGLFFSDTDKDYLLTGQGLDTWASSKTDVQVAAFSKPGGGHVSVYNLGFGDSARDLGQADEGGEDLGYIEQVVDSGDGGSSRYDVAGFSSVTALCGSSVFSVSEVGDPYVSLAQAMGASQRTSAPVWPDMLTQIYPKPLSLEEGLKSVDQDSIGDYALRGSVCRDGSILTISANPMKNTNAALSVVTWPTDGRPRVAQPIVGPDGKALPVGSEIVSGTSVAEWSPDSDHLVWIGGDGVVRSTELSHGTTTTLWDSGAERIRSPYTTFAFSGSTVYVLDPVGAWAPDMQMRLRSHDLVTGETREVLTVKLGFERVDKGLCLRGIAIRPAG